MANEQDNLGTGSWMGPAAIIAGVAANYMAQRYPKSTFCTSVAALAGALYADTSDITKVAAVSAVAGSIIGVVQDFADRTFGDKEAKAR